MPITAPSGSINTAPAGLAFVDVAATTLAIPAPGPDATGTPVDAIVSFDHVAVSDPGDTDETASMTTPAPGCTSLQSTKCATGSAVPMLNRPTSDVGSTPMMVALSRRPDAVVATISWAPVSRVAFVAISPCDATTMPHP